MRRKQRHQLDAIKLHDNELLLFAPHTRACGGRSRLRAPSSAAPGVFVGRVTLTVHLCHMEILNERAALLLGADSLDPLPRLPYIEP